MNKISIILTCALSLSLVACGGDDDGDGGSGIPDSRTVGSLTASEAMSVCLELAAIFPERTADCGGGVTTTVGIDPADCDDAPPATCMATVGAFRDCFEAFSNLTDAQVCDPNTPPPAACATVFVPECG